jgi:hypothetical protein
MQNIYNMRNSFARKERLWGALKDLIRSQKKEISAGVIITFSWKIF